MRERVRMKTADEYLPTLLGMGGGGLLVLGVALVGVWGYHWNSIASEEEWEDNYALAWYFIFANLLVAFWLCLSGGFPRRFWWPRWRLSVFSLLILVCFYGGELAQRADVARTILAARGNDSSHKSHMLLVAVMSGGMAGAAGCLAAMYCVVFLGKPWWTSAAEHHEAEGYLTETPILSKWHDGERVDIDLASVGRLVKAVYGKEGGQGADVTRLVRCLLSSVYFTRFSVSRRSLGIEDAVPHDPANVLVITYVKPSAPDTWPVWKLFMMLVFSLLAIVGGCVGLVGLAVWLQDLPATSEFDIDIFRLSLLVAVGSWGSCFTIPALLFPKGTAPLLVRQRLTFAMLMTVCGGQLPFTAEHLAKHGNRWENHAKNTGIAGAVIGTVAAFGMAFIGATLEPADGMDELGKRLHPTGRMSRVVRGLGVCQIVAGVLMLAALGKAWEAETKTEVQITAFSSQGQYRVRERIQWWYSILQLFAGATILPVSPMCNPSALLLSQGAAYGCMMYMSSAVSRCTAGGCSPDSFMKLSGALAITANIMQIVAISQILVPPRFRLRKPGHGGTPQHLPVGSMVEALWFGQWHPGQIAMVEGPNTRTVRWEDGTVTHGVPNRDIRPMMANPDHVPPPLHHHHHHHHHHQSSSRSRPSTTQSQPSLSNTQSQPPPPTEPFQETGGAPEAEGSPAGDGKEDGGEDNGEREVSH